MIKAVDCFFTEWELDNGFPACTFLCETDEEVKACVAELEPHALALEIKGEHQSLGQSPQRYADSYLAE